MAVSIIPEPIVKNKQIGILNFNNNTTLRIPIGRVTDNTYYVNIVVANANQDVFSIISRGGTTQIRDLGGIGVTVTSDGTDTVISKSNGAFWGSTLVIVTANFNLSFGG